MDFNKKIILSVGPIVLAGLVVIASLCIPTKAPVVSKEMICQSATALDKKVYTGELVVNQALSDPKYIPFIGASELSRFDMFHPNVLAEKYSRNYRPYLLGQSGSSLLNQYTMLNSLNNAPASGKIVAIVALSSFEDNDYQNDNFVNSYSELQTMKWLSSLEKVTEEDKIFADNLLQMPGSIISPVFNQALKKVSNGEKPNDFHRLVSKMKYYFDKNIETRFGVKVDDNPKHKKSKMYIYNNGIAENLNSLPDTYDEETLFKLSEKIGKKYSSNNKVGYYNPFYKMNIKNKPHKFNQMSGKYKDRYHGISKGFADFELLLSEIAERKLDAYFILPTMHPEWLKHTGLPKKSIDDLNAKLTEQLTSQGFNNILDMNQLSGDYLMQDPLHIGWRGWMELDKAIKPFLEGPKNPNLDYQLNDKFYSDEWKNYRP
ncbi:D-alanyl-lipoteichoic acid biosynthesis protein DltD [Vagococcus coleopterorum]|uniref:D-alanyl-lipoteichoic acid biosynthesis protein DltD n=1 Tax=Vagococcus coleopterorum TaxID=2714946 RepID=A0A6G8ALH9_9ENTE|nr:D-alanyl-lipoteichoic acid biosynthesis protein DltD [Vagococcus coleopterorum]QIL45785.1 D-alanyl-lipoteichoic acid biosynthesis protein DltD [Vagococcus coleopterorum]